MKNMKSIKKKLKYLIAKIRWRCEINAGANISPQAELKFDAKDGICIDNRVSISSGCMLQSIGSGKIHISHDCMINKNCFLVARSKIEIGSNCGFGPNVLIYDHDHGIEASKRNEYKCSDIIIGNNCWIGANSIILRGTIIGDECVIGAGTIVKGTFPSKSIITNERKMSIRRITNVG